jgi:hypothetical protein
MKIAQVAPLHESVPPHSLIVRAGGADPLLLRGLCGRID